MVGGITPKIRRVLCPKCRCVLVEHPDIPVYKCGRCDAVLQAKHCRMGAKLHSQAGANGSARPGGFENISHETNTTVHSAYNVSASNTGKALLESQLRSPMKNVSEGNNLKGEISSNGCSTAKPVIDKLETKIPCLDSSCKSTLDVVDNMRNRVPNADDDTGSLEGGTVMIKAQTTEVSTDQSEMDTPKDEVTNLDGCSSSNSRELSPEREVDTYGCNTTSSLIDNLETKMPCLDGSSACKSTLDVVDNLMNTVPNADAGTGNLDRGVATIKTQTADFSTDQSEIDTPKEEVPKLDGCSSINSRELSPESEIDTFRCNNTSSVIDYLETKMPCLDSSNACKFTLDVAGAPRNTVPNADCCTGNLEGDAVMVKAQTGDVGTGQSEIDTPKDEVPILDGGSSSNSRQLSPEREIDSPTRIAEHVSLDDSCTRDENISAMDNEKDEAPPTNSGCSSCKSEQLSPKANGKMENNEVKAEHAVLCNLLEESLSIGRDSSLTVTPPEENEDHVDSVHSNSKEANIYDRQISNRHGDPARKPPRMVHHAYDASVSSFEDGYASGYRLTSKRTFRSQRSSALSRSGDLDETNNSFANVEAKKATKARIQENVVPPRLMKQRYSSETVESFMSDRDELPTRYGGDDVFKQEASVGSEDFFSVQDWTETEKESLALRDLCSSSQFSSTGSDRIELLRKIDELRAKLARSHDPWDKKPHFNGSKQISDWQSTSGSSASEQEIHRHPSIQAHLLDPYSSRKSMFGGHQRQVLPPSANSDPTYFCLHCTSGSHLQANARVPAATYCSNELCGLYGHICSQPGNLSCQLHSDPRCLPKRYSHDLEKLQHKMRDHSRKRHYRPVLGGANLLTCYECLRVLQIPEDFHFSRKRCNKLRCGHCSKVLSFALVNKNQIVPYILALQMPIGGENSTSNYVSTQNCIHVPPRNHHFRQWGRDQFSYSDAYGPSLERSGEIEDEHVQYVSRDSTDSMIDRDIKKPPLHSLMGYISASEIIYTH